MPRDELYCCGIVPRAKFVVMYIADFVEKVKCDTNEIIRPMTGRRARVASSIFRDIPNSCAVSQEDEVMMQVQLQQQEL